MRAAGPHEHERAGGRGIVQRRTVTIGPGEFDGWIEVVSGLAPGDQVVLDDVAVGDSVQVEVE